jgi:PAS domain-containing protein
MEFGEESILIVLACFQIARARASHIRNLYVGFALYYAIFATRSAVAEFHQSILRTFRREHSSTSAGRCHFFGGAFWAARWQPPASQPARRLGKKTFNCVLLTNGIFVLAPLVVLVQVAQSRLKWGILRFSLFGVSILCFAVRVGIGGYREARAAETVRRQALAMDPAADGISILGENGEHLYVNLAFARMMGYERAESMLGLT